MTVANDQHAKKCEMEHQSEGVLMEELGRLLGEVKASARSVLEGCKICLFSVLDLCTHLLALCVNSNSYERR
jgi:hypothetical protein